MTEKYISKMTRKAPTRPFQMTQNALIKFKYLNFLHIQSKYRHVEIFQSTIIFI